ncbi:hypothetical protein ERJ75_001542500 [Trypanosoma vivax]|nr:hypothetical protein ERJ75_001542500 [Trypanosoma vivax]
MVSDEGSLLAPHELAIQTSPLRHRVWMATRERRVWRGAVAKKRRRAHACAGVRRDSRPHRRMPTAMRQRKSRAVRRAVGRGGLRGEGQTTSRPARKLGTGREEAREKTGRNEQRAGTERNAALWRGGRARAARSRDSALLT